MTLRVCLDARLIQWPGIGRYIGILLRGLAARGDIHVTALTTRVQSEAMPDGVVQVPVSAAPFTIAEQLELRSAMRVASADVFHSPHFNIPLLGNTPLVATVHDAAPFRFPPEGLRGIPRRMYASLFHRAIAGRCAAVVSDSAFSRSELASQSPIPHRLITPIHLAIDPAFLSLAQEALAEPSHGGVRPYALYVGTNKPWKNLEVAVRGADMAARRVPGLRLLIAGKQAASQESLESMLMRIRPSVPVEIVGTVTDEQLTRLYRDSLVVLCPSLYEGFGLTGLEAMACGAPVIHSGAASLPEVLGDAGVLASPLAPAEWADAIVAIAVDSKLSEQLSRRGRERAARFTVTQMVDETVGVYRKAVTTVAS